MSVKFKMFWHIMPYGWMLIALISNEAVSVESVVLLGLCMGISTLKADAFHRKSSQVWSVGLLLTEVVFMSLVLLKTPLKMEPFLFIILVDLFWYTEIQRRFYVNYMVMILLLTLGLVILTKSYYLVTIPLSAMWIGLSLKELENKKISAQKLYDKLRVSEDALKKANQDLEAYYDTLEEVVKLRERTRISRDIHDSVGHALATTLIQLQAIEHRLNAKNEPDAFMIARLVDFLRNALESTRSIVHHMVDASKENKHFKEDLQDLVHGFSNRTGKDISLILSENFPKVTETLSDVIYRIIQESLTNTLKHSNASKVNIVLSDSTEALFVTIHDNGTGKKTFIEGFGMHQMRKRVSELSGQIDFSLHEEEGLMTKLVIPKEKTNEFAISR